MSGALYLGGVMTGTLRWRAVWSNQCVFDTVSSRKLVKFAR